MSEEKKQRLKEYQKVITTQKSLNIIMNKIIFLIVILIVCDFCPYIIKSIYLCHFRQTNRNKSLIMHN